MSRMRWCPILVGLCLLGTQGVVSESINVVTASEVAEKARAGSVARRVHPRSEFLNVTASTFAWQKKFEASNGTLGEKPGASLAWRRMVGMRTNSRRTTRVVNGQCQLTKTFKPKKEHLVLVAVGDSPNILTWMKDAEYANFDVIALYYGDNGYYHCPECKRVFHGQAQKFRLFYSLHKSEKWAELSAGYKSIMTADDDLIMSTCEINRAFEVFEENNLLLGQISLCDVDKSWSWWRIMYQQKDKLLRYVSFVEIMAPIFTFREGFYDQFVVPTMFDAYTGWGLDFVWPFLLKYPRNRIAVIDDVCMIHPSGKKDSKSIYDSGAPYNQRVEQSRREALYGYTRAAIRRLGFSYKAVEEFGYIPKPAENSSGQWLQNRNFTIGLGCIFAAAACLLLVVAVRRTHLRWKGKSV